MNVRRYSRILSSLMMGLTILTACQKTEDAAKKPPPKEPTVGVIKLKSETVTLTQELAGRVVPQEIAEVRPQIGGIIQERLFTEGTDITKGTPLYKIDSATYQAALETAQAQLVKAQAAIETARTKHQRNETLVARGLISRDAYEEQFTEVKQAEADVGVAQAAIKTAKINLAYSVIKAPISGFIGKSAISAGALVTANQVTALASIQRLDPILVDITQVSTDLVQGKGATAPQVQLILPDGSVYPHVGHLAFTDTTVDKTTGAVTVRAEFPNPDRTLLAGMFVRAKIGTGSPLNGLLVPQQALSRKANGDASVWVFNPTDNTVNPKSVKANQAIENKWIIESGLKEGDQIVVDGFQKIKPAAKVKTLELGADGKPLQPSTPNAAAPTIDAKPNPTPQPVK